MKTGVTEALGGILLLITPMLWYGRWLTILNLIAIFPANIWCVMSEEVQRKTEIEEEFFILRLPMQFVFIFMAYCAA